LREWIVPYYFGCEPTDEQHVYDYDEKLFKTTKEEWLKCQKGQDLCSRYDQLFHADKLVARDYEWKYVLYDSDY
jgi:hypothetical protein